MRRHMNRLVALVMLCLLSVSLLSVVSFAEETSGEAQASINGVEYATVSDAIDAAVEGDTIQILKDISLSTTLYFSNKTNITLDGEYTISRDEAAAYSSLIYIGESSDITIQNLTIKGNKTSDATSLINVSDAKLTLQGHVQIQDNSSITGGAIKVDEKAELVMKENASIHDCSAGMGGAIDNYGIVTMEGDSKIENCEAGSGCAGAVYVNDGSTFTMQDNAMITGCSADQASAVLVNGTFNMNGGLIVSNTTTGMAQGAVQALVTYDTSEALINIGGTATITNNTNGDLRVSSDRPAHITSDLSGTIGVCLPVEDGELFCVMDGAFAGIENLVNTAHPELFAIAEDVSLKWGIGAPTTVTVSFADLYSLATELPQVQTIEVGGVATYPGELYADGYTFAGWFDDTDMQIPHNFDAPVESDIILYAGWTQNPVTVYYTITFADSLNLVAELPQPQTVEVDTCAVYPGELYIDGYTFAGWFDDAEAQIPHNFDIPVQGDATVYAGWTQIPVEVYYTVNFDNGGYGVAPEAQTILEGTCATRPDDLYYDDEAYSYTFAGWYLSAEDAAEYDFDTPVYSDFTVVAKWEIVPKEQKYTVSFDAKGLCPNPEPITAVSNVKPDLPIVSADGYEFTGWYRDYDSTIPFDATQFVDSDMTLYAGWNLIPVEVYYNIIFDVGGIGTTPSVQQVKEGGIIELPVDLHADGYIFGGWYIDEAKTQVYDAQAQVYSDMILYAKWDEVPPVTVTHTVSFDTNGHGTAPESQTINDGELASMPSDLTADGYKFTGWYSDIAATVYFNFSAPIYSDATVYAGWTENPTTPTYYTVTFAKNGHGEDVPAQQVKAGDIAINPGNLSETGFNFKGWYFDVEGTQLCNFTTPVNSDITLYAKWESAETSELYWKVVFNANTHGESPAVQTVRNGECATKPADLSDNGYTFTGWYSDSACTYKFDFATPITADVILYAGWTENAATYYTVVFDNQGHGITPPSQSVKEGELVVSPMNLSEEGYEFGGWYTDNSCTNEYDFARAVTSNFTLYAKWTPQLQEWVVVFNNNGRGNVIDTQRVKSGDMVIEPSAPVAEGYSFTGWYVDSACRTPYNFQNIVTTDLVLYAGWYENPTTPPYNPSGGGGGGYPSPSGPASYVTVWFELQGHGESITSRVVEKGAVIMAPEVTPSEGYTFGGWYLERSCLTPFDFSKPITADTILYAKWVTSETQPEATYYTVTFKTKYGNKPEKQKVKENDKVLKPSDPTDETHVFTNWFSDEDFTLIYNFNSAVTKDLTLYAGWKEKETKPEICTVTFDVLKHGTAPEPIKVNKGDVVEKPEDPTEEGYIFGGWYKEEELTNHYNFNRPVQEDITLYAKWTPGYQSTDATYYVKFDVGEDASGPDMMAVKAGNPVAVPDNPTKEGYTFDGWYEDAEFTKPFNFSTPIKEDTVLHAKWIAGVKKESSPVVPIVLGGVGAIAAGLGGFIFYKKRKFSR